MAASKHALRYLAAAPGRELSDKNTRKLQCFVRLVLCSAIRQAHKMLVSSRTWTPNGDGYEHAAESSRRSRMRRRVYAAIGNAHEEVASADPRIRLVARDDDARMAPAVSALGTASMRQSEPRPRARGRVRASASERQHRGCSASGRGVGMQM